MDIISERIDRRFNCSKILGETYEFSECMSIDRDFNLSIYIHFETKYKDDFYFKVFNDVDFMKATKCCRIKIFKSMYKKQQIDDSMSFFILNEDQKIRIMKILINRHSFYDTTVWKHMINSFYTFSDDAKIKRTLKNIMNKIPDYMNL